MKRPSIRFETCLGFSAQGPYDPSVNLGRKGSPVACTKQVNLWRSSRVTSGFGPASGQRRVRTGRDARPWVVLGAVRTCAMLPAFGAPAGSNTVTRVSSSVPELKQVSCFRAECREHAAGQPCRVPALDLPRPNIAQRATAHRRESARLRRADDPEDPRDPPRRSEAPSVAKKKAEALAAAARDSQAGLATKAHLDALRAELRADMRSDLYRALWIQTGAIVGLVVAVVKFL